MTDDTLKDLVTKHDEIIGQLASSIEHLVKTQATTNTEIKNIVNRLEEVTSFLAKQQIFSNKLENLDREFTASLKRFHARLDEMDNIQKSSNGCNSVRLLTKDVESIAKEMSRLLSTISNQHQIISELEKHKSNSISPTTLRWLAGLIIIYTIGFGIFTVQAISKINTNNSKISTILDRDVKDTTMMLKYIYKSNL